MEFDRAAVTGATGHLGNVLVRELVARGKAVVALAMPGEDLLPLEGLPVEVRFGDVTRPDTLAPALAGAQVVFHLAGLVSIAGGDRALHRVNVEGTRNVVRACARAGVARLVHTGSVHALAEPRGGVLDESAGFAVARGAGPYGRSKAAGALEVLAAASAGMDAVVVLPTGVLGPHDYRLSEVGALVCRAARGRLPAMVAGGYDFVDVRDVAASTIAAAQRGRCGESYLLGGGHLELARAARLVAELAGRAGPRILVPRWLALAAAWIAAGWRRLAGGTSLFTPYAVRTLGARFLVDDGKARRELGHASRPHLQSLRDAWDWMRSEPRSPWNRNQRKMRAGLERSLEAPSAVAERGAA